MTIVDDFTSDGSDGKHLHGGPASLASVAPITPPQSGQINSPDMLRSSHVPKSGGGWSYMILAKPEQSERAFSNLHSNERHSPDIPLLPHALTRNPMKT